MADHPAARTPSLHSGSVDSFSSSTALDAFSQDRVHSVLTRAWSTIFSRQNWRHRNWKYTPLQNPTAKMAELKAGQPRLSLKQVFKKMTVPLFTAWMITSMLNIMFGYDTTSFGGVQSIPAFAKEFGSGIPDAKGAYALTASRASFMSSVAFAGKLVGTLVSAIRSTAVR